MSFRILAPGVDIFIFGFPEFPQISIAWKFLYLVLTHTAPLICCVMISTVQNIRKVSERNVREFISNIFHTQIQFEWRKYGERFQTVQNNLNSKAVKNIKISFCSTFCRSEYYS